MGRNKEYCDKESFFMQWIFPYLMIAAASAIFSFSILFHESRSSEDASSVDHGSQKIEVLESQVESLQQEIKELKDVQNPDS